MRSSIRNLIALVALLLLAGVAAAAPAPTRIVLADRDPELRRSLESVLKPWRIELVIDEAGPIHADQAQLTAAATHARFVVWREPKQLVVFDAESLTIERREARDGAFDPVQAAAAALTVKTMLRLPPLSPSTTATATTTTATPNELAPAATVKTAATPDPSAFDVRLQTGVAMRVARGSGTELGARFMIGVLARPWSAIPLRLGAAGDFGTSSSFQRAGFTGSWNDWAVLAMASWSAQSGAWELEPFLAAGVSRSSMSGSDMSMSQREAAFLTTGRGGIVGRLHAGAWSAGVMLGVETTVGTPTYMKTGTSASLFEVPWFAAVAGVVIAAELGR